MDKPTTGETTEAEVKDGQVVEPQAPEQEAPESTPEPEVTPNTEAEPAGDVPTPSKTEEPEKPATPVSAQERINRMYARLQKEKEKAQSAKNKLAEYENKPTSEADLDDDDETITKPQGMDPATAEQYVEQVLARKEAERKFQESETQVLLRHETAINEDGSFNMDDPFTKAYVEVGAENPQLLNMVNGPEIAEAMAEKKLGIGYKQGRQDEARQITKASNAHTGASTTRVSPKAAFNLSDAEKKIAFRMNMTDKQYSDYKSKRDSGDKRVT